MHLSVIIPARNEPFLQQTIDDILAKAKKSIEIIAVLDGYWPNPKIKDDPRVTLIHHSESMGMRPSINEAASIAKGKYLMKCDAHCCFGEGFDKILAKDCKPDWTVVPRRYNLDTKKWDRGNKIYDFQYISHPDDTRYPMKGHNWPEYNERVKGKKICALMTSQGSCWFMHRQRFFDLGMLDDVNYGIMGREAQETCLKAWLSGGKYVLNRNTWYAHWKKNAGVKHPERATYPKPRDEWNKSAQYLIKVFWTNQMSWPLQTRTMESLIEKFKPVPTWHKTESITATRLFREKFKLNDVKDNPIAIKKFGRNDLYKIFSELKFKTGAEIGVWKGLNAIELFNHIKGLKLYLIDPYINHDYVRKKRKESSIELAHTKAHKLLENQNGEWIQDMSENAIKIIKDNSLDFVYIDAEHTYNAVMQDIILWVRKVKKGGIIAGHDYFNDKKHKCMVKTAVNDYAKANRIERFFITDKNSDNRGGVSGTYPTWFWVNE